MRRADREITAREELLRVMEQCDVCRLAFNDEEGYPYILPLNFGMEERDGQLFLYFHGACEGKKYDLLAKDARVSFEMDRGHRLVLDDEGHSCTMEYESVMGRGTLAILPDEEKMAALRILMRHYRHEDFPFGTAVLPRTTVMRLTVTQMTGKRRVKKHG